MHIKQYCTKNAFNWERISCFQSRLDYQNHLFLQFVLILIWIIFQWPFVRFLGIQEPASVLFSIFNAIGHILGWRRLRSCVPSTDYDMHWVWKIYFVVRPLERRHWFSFVVHENLIQLATKMSSNIIYSKVISWFRSLFYIFVYILFQNGGQ